MAAVEPFSIKGQVILITGASSGIGEHFARLLSRAGATGVLAARRESVLESLVSEIKAAGGVASAVKMDVVSRESVQAAVAATLKLHGRIDTLISNAGVLVDGKSIHGHSEEDWHSVLDTNLLGSWRVPAEVAKQWMLKNGGNIVMIGSVLAERQVAGSSAYLAAKAGVHQLTKAMALEWAGRGIRVNCLAPGFVLTDMTAKLFMKPNSRELNEFGAKFAQGIPAKRFVELGDLDGPLLLLCSGASRAMSGAVINVDYGHRVSSL